MRTHSPDGAKSAKHLRAKGHDLIAQGHACLAEAERLASTKADPSNNWIPALSLPLPRKRVLAACRSGVLRAVKNGRTWLTTRADADAFLSKSNESANDHGSSTRADDDDIREAFGLQRRAG